MAKNELIESAKQLESKTAELLERIKQLHSDVSASLQQAKRQESKLIEAEKAAAKAKADREREERRKEFLESGEQRGVYSSGPDEEEPSEPKAETPAEEPAAEPVKPAEKQPEPETKPAEKTPSEASTAAERQPRGEAPRGQRTDRPSDRPRGDKPYGDKPAGDRPRGDRKPGEKQGQKPRGGAPAPVVIPQNNRHENKGQYVRTFDNDKKQPKNKKTIMKETAPSANGWDDENGYGSRRKSKKQQPQHKPEPVKIEKAILTSEQITVRELSEKIGKPAAEIIKKLFMMGTIATINNEIDFDTCELIAADYDIELELQLPKTAEDVLEEAVGANDSEENLVERPPVVTIMGHVDHGKTSLLDAIRNSSVTAGEAGGITQHIGAYTVSCNGRKITFIDTPGHEAFTAMRARGAQVTDVVILVVAADDGIMPQTIEAINHSKAAGVPIIVAINKMDKPEANPDRVLQQLTEHGLLCEEWGGDTICVRVSAKTHMNLNTLLEMVLLQADVLELRANPDRKARGTIIEAQLDKGRGPVATVLVQNGTLRVGDPIVAGVAFGRVRAMMDDKGKRVKEAGPSAAVEVLGFNEVPSAGDEMIVADLDKLSKLVAEERRNKIRAEQMKQLSRVSLEDFYSHISDGEVKDLNIVIKADVDGSVEAVKQALEKLSNEEVRVKCIHGAVGAITASDVMFASASNAIVIGFNVRPDSGAKALSEQEKVDIRTYRVIYQAIEDVENAMKGMFKPVYQEVVLGTISVRNTFKVSGVGTIAGAYVSEGKVQRNAQVRVVRDGIVIHEGRIASLRRFKDDVKEVAQGYECGIGIESFNDIREGDVIEAFVMEEVKR
ncbi:MAG: translation initiation factor IF-2 [Clostridia bacterium]|nr:translation initiation factor IF-2 [Clostridia bacterium]